MEKIEFNDFPNLKRLSDTGRYHEKPTLSILSCFYCKTI